jgi:hypothetical protein
MTRGTYYAIDPDVLTDYIVAVSQWEAISRAVQRMMDEVYAGNERFFYNAPWFTDDPVRSLADVAGAEQVGQRAGGKVVYWAMTSAELAERVALGRVIVEDETFTEVSPSEFAAPTTTQPDR